MRAAKRFLAALLAAVLLCGTALAAADFNAGLVIDRDTAGQISVTVQSSGVLSAKKPMLTIACDYAYASVTAPDDSVAYCTGTGSEVCFSVSVGGTYVIKSIAELPKTDALPSPGISGSGTSGSAAAGSTDTEINSSVEFSDVPEDAWYADAVAFVSARGLLGSTSTTAAIFDGDKAMNRAMLAVVLHRLASEPQTTGEDPFRDVPADSWYTEAVRWAAQNGLVTGYDGRFDPVAPITREQLVVMLWRYAGSPTSDYDLSFCPDAASISTYAAQAMAWALETGVISGMGGGILCPQGQATRAQTAQMLKNFLEAI